MNLRNNRREYVGRPLRRIHLDPDPIIQFETWFMEAQNAGQKDSNAMALATSDRDCTPSVRYVLLKGVENGGFLFYTNYQSRKGADLSQNPKAAATFYWADLNRQVRIEGQTSVLSESDSREYFHSRPRGSQIAALISPQSQEVSCRTELEVAFEKAEERYENQEIPPPQNWGGIRLDPIRIEFWQGQENRLHDRFLYIRKGNIWTIRRLAP